MTKEEAFKKFKKPDIYDKILLLTHTDLDGSGPVILLKTIFKNVTVKHCSNHTMSYDIKNAVCNPEVNFLYDRIFVCDISCSMADAEKINANPNRDKLILLDHHGSAEKLNQFPWARVAPEIISDSYRTSLYPDGAIGHSSGTSLMYDFLDYFGFMEGVKNLEFIQTLVHTIAALDTWDWNDIFGKERTFNDMGIVFDMRDSDNFEETMLGRIESDSPKLFDETDKLLIEINERKVNSYLENKKQYFQTGNLQYDGRYYSTVFCSSTQYLQETLECMKEEYPGYDLYVLYYGTGLSIRATDPAINVGKLLEKIGGGGHPGAGGVSVPFDYIRDTIERTLSTKDEDAALYLD